jgi:hypothetical protein
MAKPIKSVVLVFGKPPGLPNCLGLRRRRRWPCARASAVWLAPSDGSRSTAADPGARAREGRPAKVSGGHPPALVSWSLQPSAQRASIYYQNFM